MYTSEQKQWAASYLERCGQKLTAELDSIQTDCPYTTIRGRYDAFEVFPFSWTSGFFGGLMWLMYQYNGNKAFLDRAEQCSRRMKLALSEPDYYNCLDNHDLGFVFSLTNVAHYRQTGDPDARIRALHAATMLAGRFNLNGRYLRAWRNGIMGADTRGYAIIDCLMNLPLLYWAAEEYADERFSMIAAAHADTVAREFLRPDGSVHHIVDFDPQTGVVRGYPRGQGYESGSAWSRGQAWGVYGFTLSYRYTRQERYLAAARAVADYVLQNWDGTSIVPVDFCQPPEPDYRDASASACLADGMIELADYCGAEGRKYADFAYLQLKSLYKNSNFSKAEQSIVQNCTEKYHGERHHIPLIYADFFLTEALMKCTQSLKNPMW